jgi:hypothetical protein
VLLGKRLEIGKLTARTQVDLAVPVQITASAPLDATMDLDRIARVTK